MRHQYTPVFREFTTSSMWAKSPAVRCVWLYLMLHADPEGFVPGTIPGLAVAANVDIEDTREAVALFMSPDPDSNTTDFEGRRLEKVPHGWRILNFVYWRELAKAEADKARKRKWAHENRKRAANDAEPDELGDPPLASHPLGDVYTSTDVDASSGTLDAPKPKPKPKPKPREEDPPLPPVGDGVTDDTDAIQALVHRVRPIAHDLDGWEPSDELRADATMAGVKNLDDRIATLRLGPIGGSRGVFKDELDDYIRAQFGRWRTWEETDRAKDAQRAAATAPSSRRGFDRASSSVVEPTGRQRAFALKHGIPLDPLLKDIAEEGIAGKLGDGRAVEVLGERITVAVKQKLTGHPVTGKLTAAERAAWGPVPTGGSIPEVG